MHLFLCRVDSTYGSTPVNGDTQILAGEPKANAVSLTNVSCPEFRLMPSTQRLSAESPRHTVEIETSIKNLPRANRTKPPKAENNVFC